MAVIKPSMLGTTGGAGDIIALSPTDGGGGKGSVLSLAQSPTNRPIGGWGRDDATSLSISGRSSSSGTHKRNQEDGDGEEGSRPNSIDSVHDRGSGVGAAGEDRESGEGGKLRGGEHKEEVRPWMMSGPATFIVRTQTSPQQR